jgi:hypothetical protein
MTENTYRVVKTAFFSVFTTASLFFAWQFLQQGYEVINSYSCDTRSVIVKEGDTLWAIAREHCHGNIGNAVDDLYERYGTIYPTQQVQLPKGQ